MEDYAFSTWCVDELVRILEWKEMYGQIVIQVFFGIHPSVVRKQTGTFGNTFVSHQQVFGENSKKLHRWTAALTEAANIYGSRSSPYVPECIIVEEIVQDILKCSTKISSSDDEDLVGIDSKIEQVESFLQVRSEDVHSVKLKVPSSISNSTPQFNYDVFLSFRGEDTRNNIISHLYPALLKKKITIFIDNQLRKGDEISPSLLTAIEESRISIVVFSKDYASSTWCLQELTKILECKEMYSQIVIPVFHGINPSDVRKQTGTFRDAFAKHEQVFGDKSEKLQRWRTALTKAANLSGWDSRVIRGLILVAEIASEFGSKGCQEGLDCVLQYIVLKSEFMGQCHHIVLLWCIDIVQNTSASTTNHPKYVFCYPIATGKFL